MTLQPLYEDDFWAVHIEWTRPTGYERVLEEGCRHDETANLYLIVARFGSNRPKVVYIGHTYQQWVSKRLTQRDHQNRYAAFRKNYPRHCLLVSCGLVEIVNTKITRKRIKEIEQVLIYANDEEQSQNLRNIYSHGVTASYRIRNCGYRCGLPKEISLGMFVKY